MIKIINIYTFVLLCFMFVQSAPVIDDNAKISPEIKCRQPYVYGDSPSVISHWSYDASKGRCVAQAGNAKNDNKFTTKQECESTCAGIVDGPYRVSDDNNAEEIRVKAFERVDEPDQGTDDLM